MAKIGISFFHVALYNDKKGTSIIKPETANFKQLIYRSLNKLSEKNIEYIKDDKNQGVSILKFIESYESKINKNHNYYAINAIIHSGHYGELGSIVDTDDLSETALTTKQAVIKPFGVSFFYSKDSDEILVALESVGINSIKDIVKDVIERAMELYPSCLAVKFQKFVPNDFINNLFEKQTVKNICILTSNQKYQTDSADNLITENKIISKQQEIIFRKPQMRSNIKETLRNLFCDPSNNIQSLIELTDFSEGVEIDDIKIEFNNKSIRYSTQNSVRITEDITDELEYIDDSNTPTSTSLFKSILEHSIIYMDFFNIATNIANEIREYNKEGDNEYDASPVFS